MLSKFFLDRPVFAWVIAIIIMVAGRSGHLQSAHLPVSPHRAAVDRHRRLLSRGLGGDRGKQRHPDHRAEDDRLRQDAVPVRHQRFVRRRPHRADLRPGDRSGSRLGQGAEQAPARHGQPARGGPAPGRHGQQIHPELPDHRGPDLGRRQHGRQRPAGLCPVQPGEGAGPGARRGRGGELRLPVRHAHLAQPRQADRLPPDGGRCHSRRCRPTTWRSPPASSAGRRQCRGSA